MKGMMDQRILISEESIMNQIYVIRNKKVMLDRDLAKLYGVATKVLNQAIKRKSARFPDDFMFQLIPEESEISRSQFVTLKRGENIKYLPYAFTEHGVAMLSSVLNSERAIHVNIQIVRAFIKMKAIMTTEVVILKRLNKVEMKLLENDKNIIKIFEIIRAIMDLPVTIKRKSKPIGFLPLTEKELRE